MRVEIKKLEYWKTEHKDMDGCQDACELDASQGLFVVADGAGTTLFPAIWARILAKHFVHTPLMSSNVFEVEWWVRLAQEEYKKRIPDVAHLLDWSIRQKALNQSSDSTLATVRISAVDASTAQAELLVFGDSCVIIGNTETKEVKSFVLEHPAAFAQPPTCIPSSLKFFNRDFHTCSVKQEILEPKHRVILASDAVSKWILSGGGRYPGDHPVWDAFQEICQISPQTWPDFIDAKRAAKEMVDDDSTALILRLMGDDSTEGDPLRLTPRHNETIIDARKAAFDEAREAQNRELVAIYYGDGTDLEPLVPDITGEEIERARKVAHALKEVMRAFRQAQNFPGLVAKMQPVWRQYGDLLQNEKCAANIRQTLSSNGVDLSLSPPKPAQQPSSPSAHHLSSLPTQPSSAAQQAQPVAQQAGPEKISLELTFYKVYDKYAEADEAGQKDRYQDLLDAAEALEAARTRYPDIHRFTARQEDHIASARSYKQAMQKLRKALIAGEITPLAEAYDTALISDHRLTSTELERIQLARRLLTAYNSDDDEGILAAHEEIYSSEHERFFTFTQQDRQRISLAKRRHTALWAFQAALRGGRLRQIAESYDPVLDESQGVSDKQRELLQLAREFVEAYDANDDYTIDAANEKIVQSSHYHSVAFTENERMRIEQARRWTKTILTTAQKSAAKVKGQVITLEQVRKVCVVWKPWFSYWIVQYQRERQETTDEAVRQAKTEQIIRLQDGIHPLKIAGHALDALINDICIRAKMEEDNAQSAFLNEFDGQSKTNACLADFQNVHPLDYQLFLKSNRLSDDDVKSILEMELRRQFFQPYFEEQQKSAPKKGLFNNRPMELEDWLEKQRKDVTYHQYSKNFEQRARWLAEQIGWER